MEVVRTISIIALLLGAAFEHFDFLAGHLAVFMFQGLLKIEAVLPSSPNLVS